MSRRGSGLLASISDAVGDSAAAGGFTGEYYPAADQLDLLRNDKGRLPPDALRRVRLGGAAASRGPGRPAGARNKRNEKVAKYFVQQYGDPIDVLGQIMTMPVDVLYEQMVLAQGGEAKGKRVTGRDAFELKRQAALDVLPYIHGKQPISVDISGKADAVIFIPGLNAPSGFSPDQLTEAVEALGVQAIERHGIRVSSDRVIEPGEWDDAPEDAPEDGDEDDGDGEGDSDAG